MITTIMMMMMMMKLMWIIKSLLKPLNREIVDRENWLFLHYDIITNNCKWKLMIGYVESVSNWGDISIYIEKESIYWPITGVEAT